MQITTGYMAQTLGFPTTYDNGKKDEDMTPDEKGCYTKIVKDLLNVCTERLSHPILGKNGNCRQVYALIFRESESWEKVEKMFQHFDIFALSKADPEITDWKLEWQLRIWAMRSMQDHITNYMQERQKCLDTLKNPGVSSIQSLVQKERQLSTKIRDSQNMIKRYLLQGREDILSREENLLQKTADLNKRMEDFLTRK